MFSREIEKTLFSHCLNDKIMIMIGARQVGKTTLLQKIQIFLQKEAKQVFFLTLEDPIIKNLLDEHPEKLFEIVPLSETAKVFVCIDEIQYLQNPTNFLKYHFDLHRNHIKLIVTGSSAFYIDQKFTDSLVGRKELFQIH